MKRKRRFSYSLRHGLLPIFDSLDFLSHLTDLVTGVCHGSLQVSQGHHTGHELDGGSLGS